MCELDEHLGFGRLISRHLSVSHGFVETTLGGDSNQNDVASLTGVVSPALAVRNLAEMVIH